LSSFSKRRRWQQLQDGSVERCREAAVGRTEAEAKRILADLAIAAPSPNVPEQAQIGLERFTLNVIPEMLPVDIALEEPLLR
jgi:hypothetical protein